MTPRLCMYRVDCKVQLDFVWVKFFSGSRCEFFEIYHVSKELIIASAIFRVLHAWDVCSVTYTVCWIQNERFSNARVEMASQNLANAPDQKRSLGEWSYNVKRCRFGNALVRVSLLGTIDTMSQGTGSSFVKAKRSGTKQTASRLCTACLRVQDCFVAEVLLLEQITCCQWSKIMNATACFALFPVSGLPVSHPNSSVLKYTNTELLCWARKFICHFKELRWRVFWVPTLRVRVVVLRRFAGTCCIFLQEDQTARCCVPRDQKLDFRRINRV